MKALDIRHPFFLPRWRRIAVTGVCVVWCVVELAFGSALWALGIGGIAVYLINVLFLSFDPKDFEAKEQ